MSVHAGTGAPACHKPQVWAVLVSIDDYAHPGIVNLRGAVNDSDDAHDLLTKTLNVPPSHIVRLINKEATRTRILDVFFSHLIINPAIEHDDTLVFYYAGYGDRRSAPASWTTTGQPDDTVELICTHDEGMHDQEGNLIVGIPSRTFGGLMRRLAHEKGDNILAIFDCCHSGGMHRARSNLSRTRYLRGDSAMPGPSIHEDLDRNIWNWQDPDAGYAASIIPVMQPDSAFLALEVRSHVVLAACAPDQTAQEHNVRDKQRGWFTYRLLELMRSALGEPCLTYARLVNELRRPDHLNLWGLTASLPVMVWRSQTPVCMGKNKYRRVFTGDEVPRVASTFPIRFDNGLLFVEAGYYDDIDIGKQFTAEVPPELQSGLNLQRLVLTVACVGDVRCPVSCDAYNRVPPEVGKALNGKDAMLHTDTTNYL